MSAAPLPSPVPAVAAGTPQARTAFAPPLWLVASFAAVLVGVLFQGTFRTLLHLWDRDQNYSHGYLVLPISLGLAYRIYRQVGPPVRGEVAFGLIGIFFGLLCEAASTVVRWPPLSYLGLVAVLRGLLVCAGGKAWASKFNFPLLFLFFMFPLPVTWTGYAALWLQDIVARVSETVLGLFVVCHRVGHTIKIAGVDRSLVVAQECSGLGQIVSFLAFAALLGHLLARPTWHRILLLVIAVPVAVAANTLRVVLMNLGAVWFGTNWMGGTLHDAPALFSLPIGILLFLFVDHVLSRRGGKGEKGPEKDAGPVPSNDTGEAKPTAETPPAPRPGPAVGRGLFVGCAVLAAGIASQLALAAHVRPAGELGYPDLTGPFASLPLAYGFTDPDTRQKLLWKAEDSTEARDATRAKLPFKTDDLLVRNYGLFRADGNLIGAAHVYMVHSRVGEDRKHHPEICVRDVSGSPEDLTFRGQLPLAEGGSAERFRFLTGPGRAVVVYYWHYTLPPNPIPGQTRLQRLHQQVGVSAPSITVQVTALAENAETLKAIEQGLLPALDRAARERCLPPGTRSGCDRIPIGLSRQ